VHAEAGAEVEVEVVERRITERLRRVRRERGLTLEQVAASAGVSAGYLSRVEQGHRIPSIGTLVVLARSLEVSVAELLADDRTSPVVRGAEASRFTHGDAELVQVSRPTRSARIDATVLRLRDGAVPPRPAVHGGEEWLHVLHGTLELSLGDEQYVLGAGDSAQFDGTTPHVLRGAPDVEVLVVIARDPADHR
jgi:transcriptional regulator with XRE-family HTH domain